MEIKISSVMVALVVFSMMTTLYLTVYEDFSDAYELTENGKVDIDGDDKGAISVMEALNDLNFISGLDDFVSALHDIATPTASTTDILGGLASAGIGALKITVGIISLPLDIMNVILDFYNLPVVIKYGLDAIFVILVGFLMIKNYIGHKN